jgi:hypothetical protein
MAMLDFTSVLYLGMHHGHQSLRPWRQLTTGRPAALGSSVRAAGLAARLAGFMDGLLAKLRPEVIADQVGLELEEYLAWLEHLKPVEPVVTSIPEPTRADIEERSAWIQRELFRAHAHPDDADVWAEIRREVLASAERPTVEQPAALTPYEACIIAIPRRGCCRTRQEEARTPKKRCTFSGTRTIVRRTGRSLLIAAVRVVGKLALFS